MHRRTFLHSLLGLAAVPVAFKALGSDKLAIKDDAPINLKPASFALDGVAIKVPSNRMRHWASHLNGAPERGVPDHHYYAGDWDGKTFKLERGCSNPAYILADLYSRTGETPNWVVARKLRPSLFGPMVLDGMNQLLKPELDWQMLADWGRHCDELTLDTAAYTAYMTSYALGASRRVGPRFTVNTICSTREEMVALREILRMHCLRWQSTDPRYRTSYPVYS